MLCSLLRGRPPSCRPNCPSSKTPAPVVVMPTDDEKDHLRSWTSEKLEWLRCVSVDSQVKPGMFETAFAIILHVNARTRVAIISDRIISDATNISTAEVFRHRAGLRTL